MLNISNLSFQYPDAPQAALTEVSLIARRGKVLGLLGPNGAGKTTLISHLAGLLAVQQGSILLDGQPLDQARAERPTRITLAPQEYAFYPMLTVAENLECFAAACRLRGDKKRERIATCITFTQLERFAGMRAEKLSGGLKRRLNLAIALLPEPELLLLDEPTAGVDPQSRAFLLDAVKALAEQGTTVLYTSHYIEEIESIADDVVILDNGHVLRAAPLTDLLAEGGAQMALRVDAPQDEVLALLTPFGTALIAADGEIALSLNTAATPAAVLQAIAASGAALRMARYGSHDLERLFMQLTHRTLRDE